MTLRLYEPQNSLMHSEPSTWVFGTESDKLCAQGVKSKSTSLLHNTPSITFSLASINKKIIFPPCIHGFKIVSHHSPWVGIQIIILDLAEVLLVDCF